MKINKDGLALHNRCAYAAFASVEKYKGDLRFLRNNFHQIQNPSELLKYYHKNCPYLILYVSLPFNKEDVRSYWLEIGRKNHIYVKFRDWLVDEWLNLDPASMGRSSKCDIHELNRCTAVPAKILEIDNNTMRVEYEIYEFHEDVLKLVKTESNVKPLFEEAVKPGDYLSKHFGHGIEKLVNVESLNTSRDTIIEAFNKRDKEFFYKNIELSKEAVDKIFEAINEK